jgi:putative DNA primase/helicase
VGSGVTTPDDDLTARLEAVASLSEDYDALMADLKDATTVDAITATLLSYKVPPAGLQRAVIREKIVAEIKGTDGLKSPAKIVDGWIYEAKATGEDDDDLQGSTFKPTPVEPWEYPVVLAEVLDEARAIFDAYVHVGAASLDTLALWTVYTHVYDAFDVSPILDLTSPTMRCGKTSALNIVKALASKPLAASNISTAAVFRVVEAWHPTLAVDEADTFLSMDESLRGILNGGHTRDSAFVVRVEGDGLVPRIFKTFCPKAIAAIGSLPPTVEDRSVKIALTRKPTSVVKMDANSVQGVKESCDATRSKIARAADDYLAEIESVEVERPAGLNDRAWNNWLPLLTVAKAAGEEWFKRAVEAAVTLSSGEDDVDDSLLALRHVHDALSGSSHDGRLSTEDLLYVLAARDDGPWASMWARELHADMTRRDIRGPSAALAKLLKPFGIKPKQLWIEDRNQRGYDLAWFEDDTVAPFLTDTDADSSGEDARDARDARSESSSGAASSVSSVPSVSEQADGGADW